MARESLPLLACACASLRRTARVVTQLYQTELQGTGLRATQFTLLQALEQFGVASQGALGRLLALDATTLRSEEHTSELQSLAYLVCRLLLEKKNIHYDR